MSSVSSPHTPLLPPASDYQQKKLEHQVKPSFLTKVKNVFQNIVTFGGWSRKNNQRYKEALQKNDAEGIKKALRNGADTSHIEEDAFECLKNNQNDAAEVLFAQVDDLASLQKTMRGKVATKQDKEVYDRAVSVMGISDQDEPFLRSEINKATEGRHRNQLEAYKGFANIVSLWGCPKGYESKTFEMLRYAIKNNDLASTEKILKGTGINLRDPNIVIEMNFLTNNTINAEVLQLLLSYGLDPHFKNSSFFILYRDSKKHLDILKSAEANINAKIEEETLLTWALLNKKTSENIFFISWLLENGADLHSNDALSKALDKGNTEIIALFEKAATARKDGRALEKISEYKTQKLVTVITDPALFAELLEANRNFDFRPYQRQIENIFTQALWKEDLESAKKIFDHAKKIIKPEFLNDVIFRNPGTNCGKAIVEFFKVDPHLKNRYGETLLGKLTSLKNKEAVEYLIQKGANVHEISHGAPSGTPLKIATTNNDVEMAKVLLKHGALLDVSTLDTAIQQNNLSMIGLFEESATIRKDKASLEKISLYKATKALESMNSPKDLVNIFDNFSHLKLDFKPYEKKIESFFSEALKNQDINTLKKILSHIKLSKEFLNSQILNAADGTPRNREILELFINYGVDPNLKVNGLSLLGNQAYRGNKESVRFLLERGANIDQITENNWTPGGPPLRIAIERKNKELIQLFLENGANPFITADKINSPFELLLSKNDPQLLVVAYKHGGESLQKKIEAEAPQALRKSMFEILLKEALVKQDLKLAEKQLEKFRKEGGTILDEYPLPKNNKSLNFLIDKKLIDVSKTPHEYIKTLLDNKDLDSLKLLFNHGLSIDTVLQSPPHNGSLLKIAVSLGDTRLVEELLKRQVKIPSEDSPLDLAIANRNSRILKLFHKYGDEFQKKRIENLPIPFWKKNFIKEQIKDAFEINNLNTLQKLLPKFFEEKGSLRELRSFFAKGFLDFAAEDLKKAEELLTLYKDQGGSLSQLFLELEKNMSSHKVFRNKELRKNLAILHAKVLSREDFSLYPHVQNLTLQLIPKLESDGKERQTIKVEQDLKKEAAIKEKPPSKREDNEEQESLLKEEELTLASFEGFSAPTIESQNAAFQFEFLKQDADNGNAEAQFQVAKIYQSGTHGKVELEKALSYFQKAADQDHPIACYNVALCYSYGKGVEKDLKKAKEFYQKAADLGNVQAQFELANCYYKGIGTEKDLNKAAAYYQKAADKNHVQAQAFLGDCYYNGKGVNKDLNKAVECFKKGADMGDARAQTGLGNCYFYGKGLNKDLNKAIEYFKKAAEQDNPTAHSNLAVHLFKENPKLAKYHFQKAFNAFKEEADQGDVSSQYYIAGCYKKGIGVDKDVKKAFEYFQKAADQGNSNAQYFLAQQYFFGEGVAKNVEKAMIYYQKAADQGHGRAYFNLAVSGDPKKSDFNYKKAFECFQKEAEAGVAEAQFDLADCYRDGNGVEKDLSKAKEFYQKAADQGYERAQEKLKKLGR